MSYTVQKRIMNAWTPYTSLRWRHPEAAQRWINDRIKDFPGTYRVHNTKKTWRMKR